MKIHLISDLNLRFNEPCPDEELLPDVDLVILNGNISDHLKRTMLYAETLCKKYPSTQFVLNLGTHEIQDWKQKRQGEMESNLKIRSQISNEVWPENLHYSKDPMLISLRNGITYNILCTFGYPKIHRVEGSWERTVWYKFHVQGYYQDELEINPYKPKETSNVQHGTIPIPANVDYINQKQDEEWKIVKKWELDQRYFKILVTHMNPYKDSRYKDLKVSPYLIHLQDGIWIGSDTEVSGISFLGAKLYANPGRGINAREKIIEVL